MKIAVLLSTFNGEKYLSQQLESLAKQTVSSCVTVYIRDDGSKDKTFDIIDNWSKKIPIVLYKAENKGPALSFWELLTNPEIQADYYAFCDQDDVWDPDKLEFSIRELNDSTHLVLCNCRFTDKEGLCIQERMYEKAPIVSILRQFVCGMAQGCSMVFTDTLRKYFLEHPVNCIPMHDTVVVLHALGLGKVIWKEEPKFSYRLHDTNVVAKNNKSVWKKIKTTWWNWKNGSRNSMALVAGEMLDKPLTFTEDEKRFLHHVKNYRSSVRSKNYILTHAQTEDVPWRAVRSYYLRVLLNLF